MSNSTENTAGKIEKKGIVRRLYDWVLHWAETPYGVPALFILAFAESSFFPIPPDVLLIALAISIPVRAFRYALVCSVGSLLGGMFGYGIGYFLWWDAAGAYSGVANFFFAHIPGFTEEVFQKVQTGYENWNFWLVFTAGFTPLPYKVITISAGVCSIKFPVFLLASVISRSARFFLLGILIYKFGPPIKSFIDKYFNLLAFAFVVLLIVGFVVLKYML